MVDLKDLTNAKLATQLEKVGSDLASAMDDIWTACGLMHFTLQEAARLLGEDHDPVVRYYSLRELKLELEIEAESRVGRQSFTSLLPLILRKNPRKKRTW